MPLQVSIVTPRAVVWKGEAKGVQALGELGEFGVLPKHFTSLHAQAGHAHRVHRRERLRYTIGTGFAEAGPDGTGRALKGVSRGRAR